MKARLEKKSDAKNDLKQCSEVKIGLREVKAEAKTDFASTLALVTSYELVTLCIKWNY